VPYCRNCCICCLTTNVPSAKKLAGLFPSMLPLCRSSPSLHPPDNFAQSISHHAIINFTSAPLALNVFNRPTNCAGCFVVFVRIAPLSQHHGWYRQTNSGISILSINVMVCCIHSLFTVFVLRVIFELVPCEMQEVMEANLFPPLIQLLARAEFGTTKSFSC
jgi:hypothetical protein